MARDPARGRGAAPCFPSGREPRRERLNGDTRRPILIVYLLCTGNSPELSNEAAAAAVSNGHRQRKRMNSHPGEECINRTKQGPPRQRPERWVSMLEEMFPRFIHRGFFQDSLKAPWVVLKPFREQIMLRAGPASIAPRRPPAATSMTETEGRNLNVAPDAMPETANPARVQHTSCQVSAMARHGRPDLAETPRMTRRIFPAASTRTWRARRQARTKTANLRLDRLSGVRWRMAPRRGRRRSIPVQLRILRDDREDRGRRDSGTLHTCRVPEAGRGCVARTCRRNGSAD